MFKYVPLHSPEKSIRLLQLSPRQAGQTTIQGSLSESSLDDEYQCLSYVWGSDNPTGRAVFNGASMPIRRNLSAFLAEATRHSSCFSDKIWIDAVSINQDDVEEKSKQVAMMWQIYSNAKHVIVWLGEGDQVVEEAMDFVLRYCETLEFSDEDQRKKSQNPFDPGSSLEMFWDAFDVIAGLEYWTRLWIVQESLLAREITLWYGQKRVPFWAWSEFCNYIDARPGPGGQHQGNAKVVRSAAGYIVKKAFAPPILRSSGDILPFQLGFSRLRYQRCQNVNDRVYALISLDPRARTMRVEYGRDPVYLLPKIFSSGIDIIEPHHFGAEIIKILGLDRERVCRLLWRFFPDKEWAITLEDVGLVLDTEAGTGEQIQNVTVDWDLPKRLLSLGKTVVSDVRYKATRRIIVELDPKSFHFSRLRSGDIVVKPSWLNMFFLYQPIEEVTFPDPGNGPHPAPALHHILQRYRFAGAFSLLEEDAWGQNRNVKGAEETRDLRIGQKHEASFHSAFSNTCLLATSSIQIRLNWCCLLGIWALVDTGLLAWDGLNGRPMRGIKALGSWEEETERASKESTETPRGS